MFQTKSTLYVSFKRVKSKKKGRKSDLNSLPNLFTTLGILGWCDRGDSNPHAVKHHHLKVACLPIPPLSQQAVHSIRRTSKKKDYFAGATGVVGAVDELVFAGAGAVV